MPGDRTLGQAAAISLDPTLRGIRWRWPSDDRVPRKDGLEHVTLGHVEG